jgi:hypothetical protein
VVASNKVCLVPTVVLDCVDKVDCDLLVSVRSCLSLSSIVEGTIGEDRSQFFFLGVLPPGVPILLVDFDSLLMILRNEVSKHVDRSRAVGCELGLIDQSKEFLLAACRWN